MTTTRPATSTPSAVAFRSSPRPKNDNARQETGLSGVARMLHLRPIGVKGRGRRAQQKGKITTEEKSDIGGRLYIAHVRDVCDKGITRLARALTSSREKTK
jgi:hypothetical protein